MEQPALSLRTGARLLVATALLALVGCGATTTQGSRRDPEVVSFEGALQNRYVPAGEANVVVSRLRVIAGEAHGARRPRLWRLQLRALDQQRLRLEGRIYGAKSRLHHYY